MWLQARTQLLQPMQWQEGKQRTVPWLVQPARAPPRPPTPFPHRHIARLTMNESEKDGESTPMSHTPAELSAMPTSSSVNDTDAPNRGPCAVHAASWGITMQAHALGLAAKPEDEAQRGAPTAVPLCQLKPASWHSHALLAPTSTPRSAPPRAHH